ncbi:TolC family protein [Phnomibacter sp. MR]|uniref:TolC family protein n=1 Tax=Phnomibacter sp. MR TaxID=3042318 RepID=UPI003A80F780
MKRFGWILAVCISMVSVAKAQDSLAILGPVQYLDLVRQYHPVVKQAGLMVNNAEAQLLASRGLFDPAIYFTNDQKTFDGKNYYNYSHTTLKVPTWMGIELMAGLENNGGEFTNREVSLGQTSYAGLSIPLAKNLLMDRRRAGLAQAKLFVQQSKAEQLLMVNDVLFEAMDAYWYWVAQYQVYRILSNAVTINTKRYETLRITVEQGDRPGIDSTEALTQLLTFQAAQANAYNEFLKAGFELSNYLWTQDVQPAVLPASVVPAVNTDETDPYKMQFKPLNELLDVAGTNHPKLQTFQFKLDALEIERQLKFQSLLPAVNLKYNILSKGYQVWDSFDAATLQNNYKFGLEVGIPLFLRQGRGDYRSAKLKIQATEVDRSATQLGIANKVKQYYNEMLNLLQQLRLQEQALQAYQKIFDVELMKFELGESTLFLLNSRENKVLESRQKVAELKAKYFKSLYAVEWAAGILR